MVKSYTYKNMSLRIVPLALAGICFAIWFLSNDNVRVVPDDLGKAIMLTLTQFSVVLIIVFATYVILYLLRARITVYDDHLVIRKVLTSYKIAYQDIFDINAQHKQYYSVTDVFFRHNVYMDKTFVILRMKEGGSIFLLHSELDGHSEMYDAIAGRIVDGRNKVYEYDYPSLLGYKIAISLPTVASIGVILGFLIKAKELVHNHGSEGLAMCVIGMFFPFLYLASFLEWNIALLKHTKGKITLTEDGINYSSGSQLVSISWSERPEIDVRELDFGKPMKVVIEAGGKTITFVRPIRFFDSLLEAVTMHVK